MAYEIGLSAGGGGGVDSDTVTYVTTSSGTGYYSYVEEPFPKPKGPAMPTIGNDEACHLCGAKARTRSTYSRRGRKSGIWKTMTTIRYQCGTYVSIDSKGIPNVEVGDDCIRMPSEGGA